jgi:L-aminopeptidase/D-esterase-like protein
MARAIQPIHALVDGDVLYAVSTNEVENDWLDTIALGVVASELAWDAVLAAVPPSPG